MSMILKREGYENMGACFEAIYRECLVAEFAKRSIAAAYEVSMPLFDKAKKLRRSCRLDFLCFEKVVSELKPVKFLADSHRSQVHSYLRATGLERGLLVNFGSPNEAEWERIVRRKTGRKLLRTRGRSFQSVHKSKRQSLGLAIFAILAVQE